MINFLSTQFSFLLAVAQGSPDSVLEAIQELIDDWYLVLIGVVIAVAGIWGIAIGLKFKASNGDEQKMKEAKKSLFAFVIGSIVMIAVATLVPLIIRALIPWMMQPR